MSTKFMLKGKMADLNSLNGMSFFNARRGTPTTEIEANRPFLLRFHPVAQGEAVTDVIACYRDNEHTSDKAEDWFVSFPDHSAADDERFFEVVFLQENREDYSYAWSKPGRRCLKTYLTPFINQDDEFCGSIVGVTPTLRDDNIDLAKYDSSYLALLLHSAEELARFCEKRNICQIVISHCSIHESVETLVYLNIKNLKITTTEIGHERTGPFLNDFDLEETAYIGH